MCIVTGSLFIVNSEQCQVNSWLIVSMAILAKSMSMPILCAISAVLRLRSSSSRTWLTISRFMYI